MIAASETGPARRWRRADTSRQPDVTPAADAITRRVYAVRANELALDWVESMPDLDASPTMNDLNAINIHTCS